MRPDALSMVAVVGFYLIYHLCQRGIPAHVNPAASLVVTYLLCIALSFVLFLVFPARGGLVSEFKSVTWISYLLAIGVVGLEAGFLFVYRTGWKISVVSIYSNVLVGLLLIPVGILFFKERASAMNGLGVLLAVFGVILMNLGR